MQLFALASELERCAQAAIMQQMIQHEKLNTETPQCLSTDEPPSKPCEIELYVGCHYFSYRRSSEELIRKAMNRPRVRFYW